MNWKQRAEQKFEVLSDIIYDNRIKFIVLVLGVVITLASQMKYLTVDTSTEGFLHKSDPMRVAYDKFREQFGRDEKVLIAIQSKDVFDRKFLVKLNKLHKELEDNVPYITDVDSLINARNTRGTQESLIVDDLFEEIPQDQKALKFKEQLAKNNPLFKDLIIDKDGTITTIVITTQTYTSLDKNGNPLPKAEEDDEFADDEIATQPSVKKEFLTDKENEDIVKAVNKIVAKYTDDNFKTLISGTAVINAELKSSMTKDMQKFIKLVVLIIAIFLALMFRRINGVVLPLFTVILTIITALSLMAIFKAPITVVTQILPSFLLAVTIGATIHLLSIFYKEFNITQDKKQALRYAMGHSGLAIVMTSLTTAAGLWSFSFSKLAPVADLGIFASAGIVTGLLYTLILLPALLALIKLKPKAIKIDGTNTHIDTPMDKLLKKIAYISTTYPKAIIAITTIIILVSLLVASQLRFSHKPIVWFDKNHPVRVATNLVDDKLKGSVTLEIVLDTKKENGLYEPKVLNAINNFSKELEQIKTPKYFIGKTLSIVDIIKETNKALNENRQDAYIIPQDKDLIAQELLLFENSGSDDLEDFVDSGFTKARITVKVPYIDAIDYMDLLATINKKVDKYFKDEDVTITGISNLLASIMEASITSSAISYIIALVLITIMMIILIGDIKIGFISMIPNMAPILVMTTIMVIYDMPLDMFTMLIGAIAIGLAVDDTVHFMHNFTKYKAEHNSVDKAVEMTLLTTGRAMIVTTIVLSFGFFVFMGASMSNIFNFGLLTGIAIIVAVLADFFLVPAIMKQISKD
jgi:predicted RND superfamily exporter protein